MPRWHVSISAAKLATLREDEAFCELLTLARIANTLRYAASSGYGAEGNIVGARQRDAAFFMTAATAAEALHTMQRMRKHFYGFPAYREHVAPLLGDGEVGELRSKVLKWLRDKAVFHYDKGVVAPGLAGLEGTWSFVEGERNGFLDASYPLADFAVLRSVLDQIGETGDLVGTFEQVLGQTLQLANAVIAAIDTLIGQALAKYGLVLEQE